MPTILMRKEKAFIMKLFLFIITDNHSDDISK